MLPKIHTLQRAEFTEALNGVAAHSHPIQEPEHLKGRAEQIRTIEEAALTSGRHVFIVGERGVGKTSLALTAGFACAGDHQNLKHIGCAADTTFAEIIRQVIEFFGKDRLAAVEKTRGWSISPSIFGIGAGLKRGTTELRAAPSLTVSTVADILATLDEQDASSSRRVVVIDEMDKITDSQTKAAFADLIKLLGDRSARMTFIFTGVGKDFKTILGHHPSSYRHLCQIPLERLDYPAALDIIDDILARFGISWDEEPTRTARFRISDVANGFPYYVHLITRKLLYTVYDDREATEITELHLRKAVEAAAMDVEEVIKAPYEVATRGRGDDVKLALWSCADSWYLERSAGDIYRSYRGICERLDREPLPSKSLSPILTRLRGPKYGSILKAGFRKGLHEFSENISRGYVRLMAMHEASLELNDLRYQDTRPKITAQVREKRYIDPRRVGGYPSTLRR